MTQDDKDLFLKYDYFLAAASQFEEFSRARGLNLKIIKDADYVFELDVATLELMTYWLKKQFEAFNAVFPTFEEYKKSNLWIVNWASELSEEIK